MNKRKNVIVSLTITALLVTSLSGCQKSVQSVPDVADQPKQTLVSQTDFATYHEVPINVNPSIKPYQVSDNFSNVTNKDCFAFSAEAQDFLINNNFVVVPTYSSEFFSIYESNSYDSTPNFITTDAMLHNYHLYFNYLLRTIEKDNLRGELDSLTQSMLGKSQKQYDSLKDTDWENAAKRNVAFFALAAKLLNPEITIPSYIYEEVNNEYQLITDHQKSFIPSPVMNIGNIDSGLTDILNEDYTQYIPRGHYSKSDDLKTYFMTMMWYGRMTFRASNPDETKSAALITLLLSDQNDYNHWNNIYAPTNFFVGKSDDLDFSQYYQLLNDVYDKVPTLENLTTKTKQWDNFVVEIQNLNPPVINSLPIYDEDIQPNREKGIKGFRFMGQRFTLDASIFQHLIYREVAENNSNQRRMLPKGLDIPAAMGSQEAYSILNEMGETSYTNYPENMKKLQDKIASLDSETQTQNLYSSWLYTLSPLTQPKEEGYPAFMQNQAWTRKQLETYLGSWTELKHDTILYAKQVYAEMGGGDDPQDDRGYVEPNPLVYGRLAALTRMTIDGMQSRGLLNDNTSASLEQLEMLSLKLKTISEKELEEQPLSDEEYDLICRFGGQLEHFWLEALKDEEIHLATQKPSALIADVTTDPEGRVLDEGTGYVSNIYVVVPVAGTLRIAKGAVYSYYEFPWPSNDRLTDEKWQVMLENNKAPAAPYWTKTYTAAKGSSQW